MSSSDRRQSTAARRRPKASRSSLRGTRLSGFGAVSCETQTIRGQWRHQGQTYRDDLIRVFVDVADEPENRQFFVEYKERLKARFQQLDLWLTTYLIEVL